MKSASSIARLAPRQWMHSATGPTDALRSNNSLQRFVISYPCCCVRPFSTENNGNGPTDTSSPTTTASNSGEFRHKQDFVTVRLEPGEWDKNYSDPLHRPAWRPDSKVKIMSPEDFDNQSMVQFSNRYQTFHDNMILLTWMDHNLFDRIYDRYCQLMVSMSERKPGTLSSTSHEYVMRVLGQEFRITARRVAAVVQLRHNEEQIRKTNPEFVCDEISEFVDGMIKEDIAELYAGVNEVNPEEYVEPPAKMAGTGDTARRVIVPDLYDQDDLFQQSVLREAEDARLIIDNHIYVEDFDASTVSIKLTSEYQKIIKKKEDLTSKQKEMEEQAQIDLDAIPKPLPESGRAPREPRSTYVAFMFNTRDAKRAAKSGTRKKKNAKEQYQNILIEHDGELRAATLAEVKMTSAKPVRTGQELKYAGVKQAWIDRVTKQAKGGWGHQEAPAKAIANESE